MNNIFLKSLILLFFISHLLAQDALGMFYLFDISKSYKEKSLNEALEVSEGIFNYFVDSKGFGKISPQFHSTGTIDANSIKSSKPCTSSYINTNKGVFDRTVQEKTSLSDCLDSISKLPFSMYTDIRGGVYNAGNSMGSNLNFRGLIIFSDMDNDPKKAFQRKLPLDNLKGISILILYSHTQSSTKGNKTDEYVSNFKKIFTEAGAKDVEAWPLQSIAVQGDKGSIRVAKYFRDSFKRK